MDAFGERYLNGQLLVAMPSMADARFQRSVIYMCAHSANGAMGIIVNQPAPNVSFSELLAQLNVLPESDQIRIPAAVDDMRVHIGGPVETGRGFVLHSADYHAEESTLTIDESVSLTATLDILKAIAAGKGPQMSLLALGYSGWAAGQLESEIQANGWLHCDCDSALLFGRDVETKYNLALAKIGIDPRQLVSEAGHA